MPIRNEGNALVRSPELYQPAPEPANKRQSLPDSYTVKAILPPGQGFCKTCRKPVRLTNAKTFRAMGRTGLFGTCPICGMSTIGRSRPAIDRRAYDA